MRAFADLIDRFNVVTGRGLAWFALFIVLIQFAVVLMRYVFGIGSIFMQELIVYLHGFLFMLASAYTLAQDGHVRVDIFYRPMSERGKAIINLIGVITLLLPVSGFILYISWDYVANSWALLEGSQEAGGLEFRYILKSALIAMPILVILQGIAELIRSILILSGKEHLLKQDEEHAL